MEKDIVLVSGAVVFKEYRKRLKWLVTRKGENDEWEIPKTIVRKGESSVRASIRMMGEQAGEIATVLEEAGQTRATTTVNGKTVRQKKIYYLVMQQVVDEILGFEKIEWLEYAKAVRRLSKKKEKVVLRKAREELTKWKKANPPEVS